MKVARCSTPESRSVPVQIHKIIKADLTAELKMESVSESNQKKPVIIDHDSLQISREGGVFKETNEQETKESVSTFKTKNEDTVNIKKKTPCRIVKVDRKKSKAKEGKKIDNENKNTQVNISNITSLNLSETNMSKTANPNLTKTVKTESKDDEITGMEEVIFIRLEKLNTENSIDKKSSLPEQSSVKLVRKSKCQVTCTRLTPCGCSWKGAMVEATNCPLPWMVSTCSL